MDDQFARILYHNLQRSVLHRSAVSEVLTFFGAFGLSVSVGAMSSRSWGILNLQMASFFKPILLGPTDSHCYLHIYLPLIPSADSSNLWFKAEKANDDRAFFSLYIWLELLYHLPLSIYAITALLRDDPKLPIHLLVYSVQTGLTTATCISEALAWDTLSSQEKLSLAGGLYTPYLLVSVFMGLDMSSRLSATIERAHKGAEAKKRSWVCWR